MINMLVGAIGGGKSYEAVVYHVIPAVKEGRKVKTNLPLNIQHFRDVFGDKADLIELVHPTKLNPRPFSSIEDYKDDWRCPDTNRGALFVIDECHKMLPKGSTNRDVEEYFAESRHAGHDHLLITQSDRKISRNIVDMVQILYRVRKNTALGSQNSYVKKVQDGYRGEVMNTEIRKYKKTYFAFYQSHTQSNKAVMEAAAKDVKPIWKHWSVYGFGFCMVIVTYGLFAGWFNLFGNLVPEVSATQVIPEPPPMKSKQELTLATLGEPVTEQITPTPPEKITHPYSKVMFHVSGGIANEDKNLSLISASQNGQQVFLLPSTELERAGYQVTYLAECSVEIAYPDTGYHEYLTCNAPSVGIFKSES